MKPRLIVLFGAAVRPDGTPSATLARRIGYARRAAQEDETACILCSGAKGRHGPSEASVMASRLLGHVSEDRLILDEASADTFDSVIAAARMIYADHFSTCTIVSDRYHIPRIALMFRILGVPAQRGPIGDDGGTLPLRNWIWMRAREAVATPYDGAITLFHRKRLLADFRSR